MVLFDAPRPNDRMVRMKTNNAANLGMVIIALAVRRWCLIGKRGGAMVLDLVRTPPPPVRRHHQIAVSGTSLRGVLQQGVLVIVFS